MLACERAAYGERCENCYAGFVTAFKGPRENRRQASEASRQAARGEPVSQGRRAFLRLFAG